MALIHHVVTGQGLPPVVFVHGFGCSLTDWAAQVGSLSARHQTVAVDLRGHGDSPGSAEACSIEGYGSDVAAVMRALDLKGAVLVGHSLGCRVVTEAALRAPELTAGVIMVDGSQFSAVMEPVLTERLATQAGYGGLLEGMFREMFTQRSAPAVAAAVVERAGRLARPVGEKMLRDLLRYDLDRYCDALRALRVPVMALQTTYSNEQRERRTLRAGQLTPYLEMVRTCVPSVRIEIIPDTGHFPQLDEPVRTTELIEGFLKSGR